MLALQGQGYGVSKKKMPKSSKEQQNLVAVVEEMMAHEAVPCFLCGGMGKEMVMDPHTGQPTQDVVSCKVCRGKGKLWKKKNGFYLNPRMCK